MRRPLRKRRTREHIIADLSVNYAERQVLLCGFTIERVSHDYGIDLELHIFNRNGEVQEGAVLVQLKATDHLRIRRTSTTFAFGIQRRDLLLWLVEPMPVILIVYDARRDTAYWLYVQRYFAKHGHRNLYSAGTKVTVRVPLAQVLTTDAVRQFARFRERLLAQMTRLHHEDE